MPKFLKAAEKVKEKKRKKLSLFEQAILACTR